MLTVLMLTTFLATGAVPPATQPSTRPAPDWIEDPTGWAGFEGMEDFALKTAPAHVKRWHEYRRLEVTPVTDDEAFLSKLAKTLAREAVFVPDVPPHDEEGSGPVPTTRPSAPDGPMDDARFASLAEAVHEAWIVLQDRPFDEQRQRYFRGRVARLDYPDLDAATIEHSLGECVDPARLQEADIWDYLERMYVKRSAAYDGAFNLRAAALDSPRGIACQIFYSEPMGLNDGLLLAIGTPPAPTGTTTGAPG